jgi:hypothetical protein
MTNHLITHRIAATCRMPPEHSVGDECHIVGNTTWCKLHCSVCNPPPLLKKPKPKKSESLFEETK